MQNKQNKTNPILWFLFAVIIPVTVAIALTLFILSFSGVDIAGWTKDKISNVPIISSFVSTNEEKAEEDKLKKSEEKVAEQETEINSLNQVVQDLEENIENLEEKILKLENRQQNEASVVNDIEEKEVEQQEKFKSMAASFKKMDKKQAALIFQDLNESVAISILEELSNDVRGSILEAMDPKEAAKLAEVFVLEN